MLRRLVLFFVLTVAIIASDPHGSLDILNHPKLSACYNGLYKIPLLSKRALTIVFNQTELLHQNISAINLYVMTANRQVLQFENDTEKIMINIDFNHNNSLYNNNESVIVTEINMKASYLNRTFVYYSIQLIHFDGQISYLNCTVPVLILPPDRLTTRFYLASIPYIIIFISIQMGILIDLEVLREIVRSPVAVTIGFICQYGLMPLLAFAISKIFNYHPLYGFALFVVGCCPGGSASNQLTVLFDGDLTLSVLMSFLSTVASFIMMPLWLYTLGTHAYLEKLEMHIPFRDLMKSLVTILGPLSIGILVAYIFPRIKPTVKRIVKPVLIILIFYFFGFGTYVNFYLFKYADLRMAFTAPLLPWLGYLLGGIAAWILKQDWTRIKTIGIETGIQNIGIAFMVLLNSLPEPENNQATIIAIFISYVSTQPFYLVLLINYIRKKYCGKKRSQMEEKTEDAVKDNQEQTVEPLVTCNGLNQIPPIPISIMGNTEEL